MKYLKSLSEKFTKRVMACPSCQRKIRIPVRPGKTLRVTCPSCLCMFDVSFKNKFFSGSQQSLFIGIIKQKLLSLKINKMSIIGLFAALILGLYLINFLLSIGSRNELAQPLAEENNQIYKEI